MARPIEPTPILKGKDAAKLAASLRRTAPADEIERRRRAAKDFLQSVRPVTSRDKRPGEQR